MQTRVNNVVTFTKDEKMELNIKKCKQMKIDLRKKVTALSPICYGDKEIDEVITYKLLGVWIDTDLKWVRLHIRNTLSKRREK